MKPTNPGPTATNGSGRTLTKAVGRKFHANGTVRYFPGNTVICAIAPSNGVYERLVALAERFRALRCAACYTLLPPSSYHMTVIQGVCDDDRKPELWTRLLPLDAPLAETDRVFREKWRSIHVPDGFRMMFDSLTTDGVALTVNLMPLSDGDARSLQAFRDDVAEKLALRFPDHDDYRFHISIGYRIVELSRGEEEELLQFKRQLESELAASFGVFASGPPRLVFFKDMFAFEDSR